MAKVFEPQHGRSCKRNKVKVEKLPLAAALRIVAILLLSAHVRAQTIASKFSLHLDRPIELVAEENYVMQQPAPAAIPFRPTISASAYAAAKQAAASYYSPLAKMPAPFAPVPTTPPTTAFKNFNGATDVDNLWPPDTEGAVGATQFVETTNSHINIFNKSDASLAKSVSLATFFNYTAQTLFDPRVVYDPVWKRWIVSADANPESSTVQKFFFAISKTSNATGAFYVYSTNVTEVF